MNEPTTIIDEVIGGLSAAPSIKPDEPTAKDPQETLEQLESDWRMKTNEPERANRPVYDEHAKPFLKKEEMYDYYRSDAVEDSYIIVAVEHLFDIPQEQWELIEHELHSLEKIPTRLLQMEKFERQIEFFNRVLRTSSMKHGIDPQFVADYTNVRNNRLHYLASLRYAQERREHAEEDRSRNDFYKKNRFRR